MAVQNTRYIKKKFKKWNDKTGNSPRRRIITASEHAKMHMAHKPYGDMGVISVEEKGVST